MSKEVKYSRLILKRSDVTTLSATTAPNTDHTSSSPSWESTDVYVGEMFLNTNDQKLWVRTDSSIKEIPLLDNESALNSFPDVTISNPLDGQVLTFSGGSWENRMPVGLTYAASPLMMNLPSIPLSTPTPTPTITETVVQEIEKISDIDDVSVSTLKDFDILIRKDSKWSNINFNKLPVKIPTLEQLENINIQDPQTEQILVYSDGTWINKTKLDKIESLSWDKTENKLIIETEQGIFNLSMQGKPIHTITEDVVLNENFHTIIVDASLQGINVFLPPAERSYGYIFIIRIINCTFNTTIFPVSSEFIYIDAELTKLTIDGDSIEKNITLQCDGNFTWYSI